MKQGSRCEMWRQKLNYLVTNHGGLGTVARATGLKPTVIDRMARGTPVNDRQPAPRLDDVAVRQIERSLDLPDGWFDATVFLPSRL